MGAKADVLVPFNVGANGIFSRRPDFLTKKGGVAATKVKASHGGKRPGPSVPKKQEERANADLSGRGAPVV